MPPSGSAPWLRARLPGRRGRWVGSRLGALIWLALPRRPAMSLESRARGFGRERSVSELRRLGRHSFGRLGMNIVEACVFFFRAPSVLLSRVELCGLEHLHAAAALGKGILVLTAHYGNWELLAASHEIGRAHV